VPRHEGGGDAERVPSRCWSTVRLVYCFVDDYRTQLSKGSRERAIAKELKNTAKGRMQRLTAGAKGNSSYLLRTLGDVPRGDARVQRFSRDFLHSLVQWRFFGVSQPEGLDVLSKSLMGKKRMDGSVAGTAGADSACGGDCRVGWVRPHILEAGCFVVYFL